MNRIIKFGKESREKLQTGINILADAVKVTLGPNGKSVLINKNGSPHITKDGVSVAKEIELVCPIEDIGARMVKQVALNTAETAGDGTTTSIVLSQFILNESIKYINNNSNPLDLKKGMDIALEIILNNLKENSISIETDEQIEQIATISTNNDKKLGKLISEAIKMVGKEGMVLMGDSKTGETYITQTKGYSIDKGYLLSNFINNNEKNIVELNNPYILFYSVSWKK